MNKQAVIITNNTTKQACSDGNNLSKYNELDEANQYYAESLNQHTQAQEMLINALQEYVEILTLESLKSH
ncbi:hypothetical protein [Helicobacter sp. T3_23-1056]